MQPHTCLEDIAASSLNILCDNFNPVKVTVKQMTVFMSPTLKKLTGHIGFFMSVRASVRLFVKNHAC